jgi:hypothetical protein
MLSLVFYILAVSGLLLIRLLIINKITLFKNYFNKGPVGDAAMYFFFTKFLVSNKLGEVDHRALMFNGSNGVCAPPLFSYLVNTFFNLDKLLKKSWIPNFLAYSIVLILVYLNIFINLLKVENLFIFTIFILFNIDNLVFNRKRISNISFTPRGLTILFGSLVSIFIVINNELNISYTFLIIFISIFFLLNSAYFGRQIVLFILLPYVFLTGNLILISVSLTPIALSLFINRLAFWKSILKQFNFLRRHFNEIRSNKGKYLIRRVFGFSVVEIFSYLSFLITLFILFFKNDSEFNSIKVFYSIVFIVFFITSLRIFSFLGESYRYISSTTFFLEAFYYANIYETNKLLVSILLLIRVCTILYLYYTGVKIDVSEYPLSIINFLKSRNEKYIEANWFSVPFREATNLINQGYGKSTFEFQFGEDNIEVMSKYFLKHPFLKKDVLLNTNYNITHILINKKYLIHAQNKCCIVDYSFNEYTLIFEDDAHLIYLNKKQ